MPKHTLPPLPYAYDALEPHINSETLKFHHDKHHQSYVDGLNKAEDELAKARQAGDYALIKHWSREAAFHGSGHILHTLFWENLAPNAGSDPQGDLAQAIQRDFGAVEAFKAQLQAATVQVEGSGWGVLAYNPMFDQLVVLQAEKHQDLTQWGVQPLLVIDAWEHAYYLQYQNRRPDFVKAVFNVINWQEVGNRYERALRLKK